MKFAYKRYPSPHGVAIERPVIPLVLRNPRDYSFNAIGYEALVDSGSDDCIFSSEIGELLGIDITAGKCVYVGGVVADERRPMYFHPIEIEVGGTGGATVVTIAAFMPDLSASGHGLLGRRGFFDQFSFLKFKDFDSELEIGKRLSN
jgi:hypothetical protein